MRKFLQIWLLTFFAACSNQQKPVTAPSCSNHSKPLYVLPYPVGQTYYLLQGNCGKFSHDDVFKYAYDFRMPVGSYITAIRGGIVRRLEERFEDGNGKDEELNYLLILHDDSTVARYMHLTKSGVLVEMNQRINPGDTIALSGNTGISTEPHLHIDIISSCKKAPCYTVPFSFRNARDRQPLQGKNYTALRY
ncbi:MAG TPA: M23 family metallopeptidase [Chitinophagaceae bacterium]|nr:M23 family metallopeptidase [Chitinophagaceae bacterium]